jgi:hypothetical protein
MGRGGALVDRSHAAPAELALDRVAVSKGLPEGGSAASTWTLLSVLAGKCGHPLPHFSHCGLEAGVRVLPQRGEPAVGIDGFGALLALLVQLRQPAPCRGEGVGPGADFQVVAVGRQ